MLPIDLLYDGRDEPPTERVLLRAGPLSLFYEAGGLRYIQLGDREILRRLYVALRDCNWNTVPAALSNVELEAHSDSFRVRYDAQHAQDGIDFRWIGTIAGDAQGTIAFRMDGTAQSTFLRNRIGFCVLHPMRECAGQPCTVEKVDGTVERGVFPRYIAPHQPFTDMRAISHQVTPELRATVRLDGDVFEMEDQRNWSDASFKTYSTPLALPFPVEVQAGTRIYQSVTLTLEVQLPARPTAREEAPLRVSLESSPCGPLPLIGLGTASHSQRLTPRELARLRALHLAHLRVDVDLSAAGGVRKLSHATAEAKALGLSLEVALHIPDPAALHLAAFRAALDRIKPPVTRWLLFRPSLRPITKEWARLVRSYVASYDPEATIGGGSNAYFAQLNRERPPVEALDLICYSINPQVHAFDNASLVETLETQGVMVESARQFADGRPLAVTPLTLKPRFNPSATNAEPIRAADQLPPQVDVRQMSLLGAGWTVGSLKHLAQAGVHSVTYYETTGWRGVMETEGGSPLPGKFRSLPGSAFPVYHVLADVGEFAGGEALPTKSSDPLCVQSLAMRLGGRTRVILANLTDQPQRVTVAGLGEPAQARVLDERNAEEAMREPDRFRAHPQESFETSAGTLVCGLLPFAICTLTG